MGLILYQGRYTQTIQDTGEEGKRERRRKGERGKKWKLYMNCYRKKRKYRVKMKERSYVNLNKLQRSPPKPFCMWLCHNQVNTKHALELEGRCELRDFNWRLPGLNAGRIGEMTGWAVFTTDNLSSTPGTSHHKKVESAPDSCPDFHICATLNKHITNNCNLKLFNLVPAGSSISSLS